MIASLDDDGKTSVCSVDASSTNIHKFHRECPGKFRSLQTKRKKIKFPHNGRIWIKELIISEIRNESSRRTDWEVPRRTPFIFGVSSNGTHFLGKLSSRLPSLSSRETARIRLATQEIYNLLVNKNDEANCVLWICKSLKGFLHRKLTFDVEHKKAWKNVIIINGIY